VNTLETIGNNWELVLAGLGLALTLAGIRVRGRRNKPLR